MRWIVALYYKLALFCCVARLVAALLWLVGAACVLLLKYTINGLALVNSGLKIIPLQLVHLPAGLLLPPHMKRFILTFSSFLIFLFLMSGCVSTYMPNVPNTPMFTQKGELSAGGHVTPKGNISFNTAYAVSDHFGVMLNGSVLNNERRKRDLKHNLLEVAGGYFTTFGNQENRILEVYGGLGRGSSDRTKKHEDKDGLLTYDRYEASFSKYFVQVNFSSKRKKSLQLFNREFPMNYGTALRASYLNMNTYRVNGTPTTEEDNIFLEPVFYTRLALSDAVQLQYTSGANFGLKNRKSLTAGYAVFSLGLVVNVRGLTGNR